MIYQLNAQESEPSKHKLEVIYSKNIEVFCTLINLTDYWEERHTDFPFAAEARKKFLPFQSHQVVNLTSKFLKKQWHTFFCHLALYLTDFPEAKVTSSLPQEYLNWFEEELEAYVAAIRDFYHKADYEGFWKEKKRFYEDLRVNIEKKMERVDVPKILEDFYGMKKDRYFVVPAPQMPDMGLNVEIESDARLLSYYFQGPMEIEKGPNYFINIGDLINNAFHEFGHTFLESILNRNNELLQKYDYIYKKVQKGMKRRGYGTWHQVFIENLIRSIQARLMSKALGEKTAQLVLDIYSKQGFQLIHILHDITEEYERNREKYESFDSFLPVLFIRLDEKMKNQ